MCWYHHEIFRSKTMNFPKHLPHKKSIQRTNSDTKREGIELERRVAQSFPTVEQTPYHLKPEFTGERSPVTRVGKESKTTVDQERSSREAEFDYVQQRLYDYRIDSIGSPWFGRMLKIVPVDWIMHQSHSQPIPSKCTRI